MHVHINLHSCHRVATCTGLQWPYCSSGSSLQYSLKESGAEMAQRRRRGAVCTAIQWLKEPAAPGFRSYPWQVEQGGLACITPMHAATRHKPSSSDVVYIWLRLCDTILTALQKVPFSVNRWQVITLSKGSGYIRMSSCRLQNYSWWQYGETGRGMKYEFGNKGDILNQVFLYMFQWERKDIYQKVY